MTPDFWGGKTIDMCLPQKTSQIEISSRLRIFHLLGGRIGGLVVFNGFCYVSKAWKKVDVLLP